MTLTVTARHRLGEFALDVDFAAGGRLTALFGPSGSGKSTLVNLIAGLIRPDLARIAVEGRVLVDTEAGIFVPVHRRRIGYVFQDARLFPHLTVARNLAYGRLFAPRAPRRADAAAVIELLGIGHLLNRYPIHLSGGERQRVAIGRALLSDPMIVLMDEPLASLDEALKAEILPYVERLRDEAKVPIVYVSHSFAEVARLASDVVLMKAGRSVAAGPAGEVLTRVDLLPEEDRDEVGSLVELTVAGAAEHGLTVLHSSAGTWRLPRLDAAPGTVLRAHVRARDVMLATQEPRAISALNVLAGSVAQIVAGPRDDALVRITSGSDSILARITCHSVEALGLEPGRPVYMIVKAVTLADRHRPRLNPPRAPLT
ncbi:MAG: molybdenum ABC transporter ATP-binding protein [Hyphomicrobiaceae bacterium]